MVDLNQDSLFKTWKKIDTEGDPDPESKSLAKCTKRGKNEGSSVGKCKTHSSNCGKPHSFMVEKTHIHCWWKQKRITPKVTSQTRTFTTFLVLRRTITSTKSSTKFLWHVSNSEKVRKGCTQKGKHLKPRVFDMHMKLISCDFEKKGILCNFKKDFNEEG